VTRRDHSGHLRLLTVGGARGFTSTQLVNAAVARGHRVTVLTRERGLASLVLPPEVEMLVGDRTEDLDALVGRDFDAVIDFGAFDAEGVTAITRVIRHPATRYVLISSIMVYAPTAEPVDESSELLAAPDDLENSAESRWLQYGRGKVRAERRAAESGLPTLIVRPGVIVGPSDPLAHLQYWIDRWQRPGDILVPGAPADPVQFIDCRDLAEWTVSMVERQMTGIFNAVGPDRETTMAELMRGLASLLGQDRSLVWVESEWLSARGVPSDGGPFFWVKPERSRLPEDFWISYKVAGRRARAEGLVTRQLEATLRDVITAGPGGSPEAGGWAAGVSEHEILRQRLDEFRGAK
jgi:2'-hydroxyisoflavone reductase